MEPSPDAGPPKPSSGGADDGAGMAQAQELSAAAMAVFGCQAHSYFSEDPGSPGWRSDGRTSTGQGSDGRGSTGSKGCGGFRYWEGEACAEVKQMLTTTLSRIKPVAPQMCCVLMQPELYTANLADIGFLKVKTSAQFSSEFWESKPCPENTRAVLFLQCGLPIAPESMDALMGLSQNANASLILVVLVVNGEELQQPSGVVQDAQGKLLVSGADEVITLFTGEPLPLHRLNEVMDRLELKAQMLSQQLAGIQQEAAKEVHAAKLTCRNMQTAWKRQMWSLPGETLVNIPPQDPSMQLMTPETKGDRRLGRVANYELLHQLGKGSFGSVCFGQHPEHGVVAIKIINKGQIKNVSQLFKLDQEIGIMNHLPPHGNVIHAVEVLHTQEHILFVMGYGGRMNLHKYVLHVTSSSGSNALPQDLARSMAEQQAMAVAHLHSMRVGHRDLKPENFVVTDEGSRLQLTDFGLSVLLYRADQRSTFKCGSLPFCAPEVLKQGQPGVQGYDPLAADCWSLAVNLAELCHGPYSIEKLLSWVPRHPVDSQRQIKDIERLGWLLASHPNAKRDIIGSIIPGLLALNPEERWTMADVMGTSGFGMTMPPTEERSPGGVHIYMQDKANSAQGITVRAVPALSSQSQGGAPDLLHLVGGEKAVQMAVTSMFDWAIMRTVVGQVLENQPASIPALRSLYIQVVFELLAAQPGSPQAKEAMDTMSARHACEFNDFVFDTLMDQVPNAFESIGVGETTVRDVQVSLAQLRSAVTHSWRLVRSSALQPRPASLAARAQDGLAYNFVGKLTAIVRSLQQLAKSAPMQWSNPEAANAHLCAYLQGNPEAVGPLPVRGTKLPPAKLLTLLECADMALAQAGWDPTEAAFLRGALRLDWEFAQVEHTLAQLASNAELAREGMGGMAWMSMVVQLHAPLASHPCTRAICLKAQFVSMLGQVGEMMSSGRPRDLQKLSEDCAMVGISHEQFDTFLALFAESCAGAPQQGARLAKMAVSSFRPWVVRNSL